MPHSRVIRSELLESDPWNGLKDNADRLAWLACFLTADVLGDMPAGSIRLMRLWRGYGIDTPQKVAKVLAELVDSDLVRLYEVDGKPYLHIPKYRQKTRWLGHIWPLSPWVTIEQKQRVAKKAQAERTRPHADRTLDVDVDVDVEKPTFVGLRGVVGGTRVSPSAQRTPPKRFVPPTQDEVTAFIADRAYDVDPHKFWNHYQANGWKVGRNGMRDWKAAVRTWVQQTQRKLAI